METPDVIDIKEFCNQCGKQELARAVIYSDATYLTFICGTKKTLSYDPRGEKTG